MAEKRPNEKGAQVTRKRSKKAADEIEWRPAWPPMPTGKYIFMSASGYFLICGPGGWSVGELYEAIMVVSEINAKSVAALASNELGEQVSYCLVRGT